MALNRWISAVRPHHGGTYQHCMLVPGVAVAFGQIPCIPSSDLKRLAFAALVHDAGKANVPLAILDKPGPLTADEMAIMRQHPVTGADLIASSPGIEQIVVDVVRHHHEYLDGSGYPDGLRGDEIPDLVRIATIADIFGALVEKRAYKATRSGLEAMRFW
jgi:putative nucleotidyltransferase with HDIG domain